MRLFRSEEERAREDAERKAQEEAAAIERAAAQQERTRREWLASPLGQATTAKELGHEFFEVQLNVGVLDGESVWGSRDATKDEATSSAEVLAEVERLGWRLEHVGYLFKMTGQSSSDRIFVGGEETAVSGVTVGIYLFRNDRSVPAPSTGGPEQGLSPEPAELR